LKVRGLSSHALFFLSRVKSHFQRSRSSVILKCRARAGLPVRIVVGASETKFLGWISTEQRGFDITSQQSMSSFLGEARVNRLLMEHVVEHLTSQEFANFLRDIKIYLTLDARIRIAVPDAYHPSPWYREQMGINGLEPGAHDHKAFWSVDSMEQFCRSLGFQFRPLEYFDHAGRFHFEDYDERDGYISRSMRRYDGRLKKDRGLQSKLFSGVTSDALDEMRSLEITYTSLIADLSVAPNSQ